jgi:O-antigen ligase
LLFFSTFYIKLIQKKWYYIFLFIIPFLLYNYSPNLQNKINYLKYDIQQLNTPDNNLYSDARRIVSYQIAIDIFKENKILGVGITNYKTKTQEKYIEKLHFFDADKMKYVHNSYLHILASCGILGLIFFMISIICIYLYYIKERNYITLAMISLYFLVCFWDAYTEQLVGMSILYLIVILGNQKNKN